MSRVPSWKVVASSRASAPQDDTLPVTLIVSTDPAMFASRLGEQLGRSVFTFDQGEAALKQLHQLGGRVQLFMADFRSLTDGWTGQKFLKYIRDRREFDGLKVFLMADHWQAPQEQWIVKCGAEGFIKRQLDPVATKVLGTSGASDHSVAKSDAPDSIITAAGDPWMEAVNQVFKRFAGALGARLLTMQALEAMESRGQGDRYFYVSDLSARLMNPGRRSEFLAALKQAGLVE